MEEARVLGLGGAALVSNTIVGGVKGGNGGATPAPTAKGHGGHGEAGEDANPSLSGVSGTRGGNGGDDGSSYNPGGGGSAGVATKENLIADRTYTDSQSISNLNEKRRVFYQRQHLPSHILLGKKSN